MNLIPINCFLLLSLPTWISSLTILFSSSYGGRSHIKGLLTIGQQLMNQHQVYYVALEDNLKFVENSGIPTKNLGSPGFLNQQIKKKKEGLFFQFRGDELNYQYFQLLATILVDCYKKEFHNWLLLITENPPDLMVCDFLAVACRDIAQQFGIPLIIGIQSIDGLEPTLSSTIANHWNFAPISTSSLPIWNRFYYQFWTSLTTIRTFQPVINYVNKLRLEFNLTEGPFLDFNYGMVVANSYFGFEIPRSLPPHFKLIGPILTSINWDNQIPMITKSDTFHLLKHQPKSINRNQLSKLGQYSKVNPNNLIQSSKLDPNNLNQYSKLDYNLGQSSEIDYCYNIDQPSKLIPYTKPDYHLSTHKETLIEFLSNHQKILYIGFGSHVVLNSYEIQTILNMTKLALKKHIIHGIIWGLGSTYKNRIPATFLSIPNLKIISWADQPKILAHPHTKLFLSHCGLESIIESIQGLTPLLCYPFFADQPRNAKKIQDMGIGYYIDSANFDNLFMYVNQSLHSHTLSQGIQYHHDILINQASSFTYLTSLFTNYAILAHQCRPHQPYHPPQPPCELSYLLPPDRDHSIIYKYHLDILLIMVTLLTLMIVMVGYLAYRLIKRGYQLINPSLPFKMKVI